jgi:hypothetical protein
VSSSVRRCPVCGHHRSQHDIDTPHLSIDRCPRCGHRVAAHRPTSARQAPDYHRQYDGGEFLGSLATTRRSQAKAILARIHGQAAAADAVLDLGAGRGWFLEEASASGVARLAGADTSRDAVMGLRDRGIEGLLIPEPTESGWNVGLDRLSFRPRILMLLDVIEHFPPPRLPSMFRQIVDQLRPELELVVVKVPVADGLLYRTAQLLARARMSAPLEQLYQVGTYPPHWSYFTRRSLRDLLSRHGWRIVDGMGLLEFDPATFGARVAALRQAPRVLTRSLGAAAAFVAERTWHDSYVALARPTGRP